MKSHIKAGKGWKCIAFYRFCGISTSIYGRNFSTTIFALACAILKRGKSDKPNAKSASEIKHVNKP